MDAKEFRAELLKQEIDLVFQKINHFDGLRYRTKQMAVALWVAIIGVGLAGKIPPSFDFGLLAIFASLVVFPFWHLDARFHAYQEGFNIRRRAIEAFLNCRPILEGETYSVITDESQFPIPDIYGNHTPWLKDLHRRRTNVWRNAFTKRMLVFYLPLIFVPFLLAWLVPLMSKEISNKAVELIFETGQNLSLKLQ